MELSARNVTLLTNPFWGEEENSGIVTSDSAFKGLYCTELRSAPDNAQHPIAIQAFFTTLSNVSFFLGRAFSLGKVTGQWRKPPAPFMVTIFAHDKVYSSWFANSVVKKNEPWIDFPTITVVQT